MDEMKSVAVKAIVFEMIKSRFSAQSFWKSLEPDLAIFCSDLSEPTNTEKTKQFVKQLKQIKEYLVGHDVIKTELEFLDQEIERHENTKMITLYEEEDDEVDQGEVERYARHGANTEGVVGIHLPYNYTQLGKLTNGVFRKTGLIKFYISREKTIYGKIIGEVYEHPQEIPIATLIESKKSNKETGEPEYRGITLFGTKMNWREHVKVKEINLPFYVYRFITEGNKEMILMSSEPCEIGDYIITGVMTQCDDYKMLTDSAKLPTKLPFFFSQKVMNRIVKFKNHEELKVKLDNLKINRESFFDYPFTIKKNKQHYKLLQPYWYKLLIWSWLTHQPKGLFNTYPMHIIQMGPKHSGKSLQLNGLHEKSKEARSIFSGSSSTLKSLVPSFKSNPAKIGYLGESNRFAFCDEFFRCLFNTRTSKEGSQREESVAMMNDLLEWQKRRAGSGVSGVNVNMTSRVIATTNPIRGINTISDLVNSFDESFLSRWLIYYQTEDHVSMIRHSRDDSLEKFNFKIADTDWIAILDYLHSFSADYNVNKVYEIHSMVPSMLSETLNRHYDARHKHHIECLMDGIVKSRCIVDGDMSFKAIDEDYDNLKLVWMKVVTSWMNTTDIKNAPLKSRIHYMPENCQYIYWKVVNSKKPMSREDIEEIALKAMKKSDFYEAYALLVDNELMVESGGLTRPYYMEEHNDNEKQEKL